MKSRLESVALTDEDWRIWSDFRHVNWGKMFDSYRTADRRDADLMLQLTHMRNSLRSLKLTTQRMIDGLTETEKRVLRERFGHDIS